jgi:DNA-binding NarL/FixJ family response regulator
VSEDPARAGAEPRANAPTRVATVVATDERPLVRAGISAALDAQTDVQLEAVCRPAEAVPAIEEHLPAVLLVSIAAQDQDPFHVVATTKALHPALRVLVVTDAASVADLREGVAAGADSFVLSTIPIDELAQAVVATARGDRVVSPQVAMQLATAWHDDPSSAASTSTLSPRELQVLQLLAEGMTNQQIGEELGLSARTVKTHVQNLLAKLDAPDRTGAVARAFRLGLIR